MCVFMMKAGLREEGAASVVVVAKETCKPTFLGLSEAKRTRKQYSHLSQTLCKVVFKKVREEEVKSQQPFFVSSKCAVSLFFFSQLV